MAFGPMALVIAGIFTGAAFYVNFAEQPARLILDDRAALTQWKPSYHRGFIMQASIAIVGFLFGVGAWFQDGNVWWLIGACVLLANWPFTLLAIMPTNKALMATPPEGAGPKSRELMQTWGKLHAVRTSLGAIATAIFLWLLV
jgi:Domain of unknown function (DUF1772)